MPNFEHCDEQGRFFSPSAVSLREEMDLAEGLECSDAGPGFVSTSRIIKLRQPKFFKDIL